MSFNHFYADADEEYQIDYRLKPHKPPAVTDSKRIHASHIGESSGLRQTDRSRDVHRSSRLYYPCHDEDLESLRGAHQDLRNQTKRLQAAPVRNLVVEVPQFNSDSASRSSSSESNTKEQPRSWLKKTREDVRDSSGVQASLQQSKSHLLRTSKEDASVMKPILRELNSRILMSYQERDSSARLAKKHGTIFSTYDYTGEASASHSKDRRERTYAMRASRDSRESESRPTSKPVLKPKKPVDQPLAPLPNRSADRRPSLAGCKTQPDRQVKLSMQTKVFQVNVISRRQPSKVCCPNCYNIFAVRDSHPLHEKQGNELSFRPLDSPKQQQRWNRFHPQASSRDEELAAPNPKHPPPQPRARHESKENLFRNEYLNQASHNYT